jgi:hypothetical protein
MHVLSHARLTVFGFEHLSISKICERPKIPLYNKHHISTAPPISACWATQGNKSLSPKGNATIAPLTACDAYNRFISEFYHRNSPLL